MSYRLGPREMRALTILAENYGGPGSLAARDLMGVSMSRGYRYFERWRGAHMISDLRITPVPGTYWVFPTAAAAESLLGFSVRPWKPTPKMADHVTTTLRLRLAITGLDLDRWIGERALRNELGGQVKAGERRPHIHDGRYFDSEGRLWAVEVELTPKNEAYARFAVAGAFEQAQAAGCYGLFYYYRGNEVRNVIVKVAQDIVNAAPNGPKLRYADVDEVIEQAEQARRKAAEVRPGLRLIDGGASDHDGQAGHDDQPEDGDDASGVAR